MGCGGFSAITGSSVNKLFLAGVLPGLLSLVGVLVVIFIWTGRNPHEAPIAQEEISDRERWMALFDAWPALLLFVIIIRSIYGGIFTATEAAAVCMTIAIAYGVFASKPLRHAPSKGHDTLIIF